MINYICATLSDPDDQAFMLALYRKYKRVIWSVTRRSCHEPSLWEDAMQESVLHLCEKVGKLRSLSEDETLGYVIVTTRNTTYTFLRKLSRDREKLISMEQVEVEDTGHNLEDLVIQKDLIDRLAVIWPQLTEEERFILEGRFILDRDSTTLGRALGCQPATLRMKLTRARRRAVRLVMEEDANHEKN